MPQSAPLPRGDKRERTRKALLAAAANLVEEQGFTAASLEAIAKRAGMTKGAIYSNFRDKTELLLALRTERAPMLQPQLEPGAPLQRQLRLIAESLVASLPGIQAESRFIAEYQLHAQTDADFRRALETQYEATFAQAGPFFAQCPDQLRISGETLMILVQSLTLGFIHQSFLSPHAITPDIIYAAFDTLARGAVGT